MSSKQFLKFPKGFLWGGATSAEQSEGYGDTGKGLTVWDKFFEEKPEMFYKGVGPKLTSDFARRYKEDVQLFREIGSNSVRLGFSWARLFPSENELNPKAVAFYHDLINEVKKQGLTLIMTLFHFDMPLWAQDEGGWESRKVISAYVKYADFVFREYGEKVDKFATMNEPIVPVIYGYLLQRHWPMVQDAKRMFQAGFGTILAHCKVVNLYNEKFRKELGSKIGVVINISPAYAKDGKTFSKEDKKAADVFNMLHNFSMLDPMIKGEFPKGLKEYATENKVLPKFSQRDLAEIRKVQIDFVGANFYAPTRVQKNDSQEGNILEKVAKPYAWPQARKNVFRGWEIYPKAIYDMSLLIKKRYNNIPFYVSENGMGVQDEYLYRNPQTGQIDDNYRIAFVEEHLYWLHKAVSEGANCFGYHLWAIIDCWSWCNAYKNTYGFIEVDFKNHLQRKKKKSALWLKKVASENQISKNFKRVEEFMDLKQIKFKESI